MFEWEPCLLLLVWKLSWILPHPPSQRPVPKRQITEEYIKGGCLKKGTLNINHTCFKTPGPPPLFRSRPPSRRFARRSLPSAEALTPVRPCFPSLIIPLFSRQISSSKSTLGGKTPSAMRWSGVDDFAGVAASSRKRQYLRLRAVATLPSEAHLVLSSTSYHTVKGEQFDETAIQNSHFY